MSSPTVFISYSHLDIHWKDRLLRHLGVLREQGLLDTWDDRRIGVGQEWLQEIEAAMSTAKVAVFLISANFLTSRFILDKEVPALLERREKSGMWVVPVLVEDCAWDKVHWLAKLQMKPDEAKPLELLAKKTNSALAGIAREILKIVQEAPDLSDSFLEAYRQSLSSLFHRWDLSTAWLAQAGGAGVTPIETTLDDMYLPLRFADDAYSPRPIREHQGGGQPLLPKDLLAQDSPVVIRGPAGAGKTTWMRWTFRRLLEPELNALPIMLVLRDLARLWREPGCTGAMRSLDYFLDSWVGQYLGEKWQGELRKRLSTKVGPRPVLLVDGWDEIGPLGNELREKLVGFMRQYPRLQVVVTSRPYGEGRPSHSEGFNLLTIQTLSKQEIHLLAERFFQRCYGDDETAGNRETKRFVNALERSPNASALAQTALLLTMMLLISRSRPLPDKRHLLYEACIENLLTAIPDRRTEEGALLLREQYRPVDSEERMRLVAELAFAAHSATHTAEHPTEYVDGFETKAIAFDRETMAAWLPSHWPERQRLGFLDWLAGAAGILTDRADGSFIFTHLSFQEYMAAWHLNALIEGKDERIIAFQTHVKDRKWWETLRLWGALIEKQSPARLQSVLEALGEQGDEALCLVGTMVADGLGTEQACSSWISAFRNTLSYTWPAGAEQCAQAWRASRQEIRKHAFTREYSGRAPDLTWEQLLRYADFCHLAGFPLASHLIKSAPASSRALFRIRRTDRVTDKESFAAGRILCGGSPLWPTEPAEVGLLQAWPTSRRLIGLRLQLAATYGAERGDLALLTRAFLHERKAEHDLCCRIARELAELLSLEFSRDLCREWARYIAEAISADWDQTKHHFLLSTSLLLDRILGSGLQDLWRIFVDELVFKTLSAPYNQTSWIDNFALADLTSMGRCGSRSFLAHGFGGERPEARLLSAACELSLHPERGPEKLEAVLKKERSFLDPLWPALARHLARRSSEWDRELLKNLAQNPEQREPPLSWGLQFIVRGDILTNDGSIVPLDELTDVLGIERLPYLEEIPDELEVEWNEKIEPT